jgi:hypothetical protein
MMALLMDTDQARLSSAPIANLPPRFSWPSDVTEQVDLARASHRRRWRQSPRGVILPWDAALGPEIALLAGGKLEWALRPSSGPVPSLTDDFKIPLLRPALFPRGIAARAAWFKDVVEPALIASGAFGPVEVSAPEDLAALETLAGGPDRVEWILVGDQAAEDFASLARVPAATPDFTPWIGEADENRAWELLGLARASVSEFQNSGRADLRTLEMAQREIFTAESGRYFFLLGSETEAGRDTELKREFMATLNQVYQIMGVTIPPEVQRGFDSGGAAAGGDDQDGAFSRDGASFRWGDAANDDRGPGDYFYPTGSHYVSGAWDLRAFSVRPAEDWLVLTFDFTALPNPWGAPGGFSFPLVDVYMDINRSVGAGSQELLPGRPGQAAATDAWEYALSVDGWGARLFQYAPGRPPRAAGTFPVARVGEAGFAVSLPRGALRGDPGSMGFAVVVMGRSPASAVPMPAAVNPGPTQFGGAAAGRAAPPFIDLLAPRGLSQRHVLGAYKAGQEITIPFLHAE